MVPTTSLSAATGDAESTRQLAAALARTLTDGDLLVLSGDLGAGKTCLVQGLGPALGVVDRITSPTFTLVATYDGAEGIRLNHLDVYRIEDASEMIDLDLPDLLEDGVTVIEWGERIEAALPAEKLVVELRFGTGDDDRHIRFDLAGERWLDRAEAIRAAVRPWSERSPAADGEASRPC